MMIDEIAYKNNSPQPKRKNTEDFSDWPNRDVNKKFKRTPKHQRNKLVQGFYAGTENGNEKYSGAFQTNTVDPYPAVRPMGLTRFGDKQSLYTTGDLEHDTASGISSAIVRGDTDDMSVPNLEGTDFDNVRPSKKYGNPYVPLTQQEKDQLISQVYSDRHVPIITGDDFDNMQSAGKSRKRSRKRTEKKLSGTISRRVSGKSKSTHKTHSQKRTNRKRGGQLEKIQKGSSVYKIHEKLFLQQLQRAEADPTFERNIIHAMTQYNTIVDETNKGSKNSPRLTPKQLTDIYNECESRIVAEFDLNSYGDEPKEFDINLNIFDTNHGVTGGKRKSTHKLRKRRRGKHNERKTKKHMRRNKKRSSRKK